MSTLLWGAELLNHCKMSLSIPSMTVLTLCTPLPEYTSHGFLMILLCLYPSLDCELLEAHGLWNPTPYLEPVPKFALSKYSWKELMSGWMSEWMYTTNFSFRGNSLPLASLGKAIIQGFSIGSQLEFGVEHYLHFIVFLLIVGHLTSQFLATKCQGHSPNHYDNQNSSPTFPKPWEKGENRSSLVGKLDYSNGFPPHLVVWEDPCSRVMLDALKVLDDRLQSKCELIRK